MQKQSYSKGRVGINATKICITVLIGWLSLNHRAFAKAMYIPLPQKVAQSDLIAHVQVLSIHSLPVTRASPNVPLPYRSIARIRIIQAIKGAVTNTEVNLEFDNGLGCPNVLYRDGEDCLLFASRMKNGDYETVDFMYGAYDINRNTIQVWQGKPSGRLSLAQVIGQIEKYVKRAPHRPSRVRPLSRAAEHHTDAP